MPTLYVCPYCEEEYLSSIGEFDSFECYECPNCESDVDFEGNEKKERTKKFEVLEELDSDSNWDLENEEGREEERSQWNERDKFQQIYNWRGAY